MAYIEYLISLVGEPGIDSNRIERPLIALMMYMKIPSEN